jgi:hypothetical protein
MANPHQSLEGLTKYHFEWVLPGHGQRFWLEHLEMQVQLRSLMERMRLYCSRPRMRLSQYRLPRQNVSFLPALGIE